MAKETFTVTDDETGMRLDQVVPKRVAGLSRRKARAVIDEGGVFVDRTRVKIAGRTVRPGQIIEVNIGGAVERTAPPLAPTIVFSDEHIIIADKPAPTEEQNALSLVQCDPRESRSGPAYTAHRWLS